MCWVWDLSGSPDQRTCSCIASLVTTRYRYMESFVAFNRLIASNRFPSDALVVLRARRVAGCCACMKDYLANPHRPTRSFVYVVRIVLSDLTEMACTDRIDTELS